MQPYFFPYLGYFQLLARCDDFIVLDNVQYIGRGWINRNRILRNGQAGWLTFPVAAAPRDFPINNRRYLHASEARLRMLRQIDAAYRSAPFFDAIKPLIVDWMMFDDLNVATFNTHLISELCGWLGIHARISSAAELAGETALHGQERILELCKRTRASHYLNPPGGVRLYDAARFADAGVELCFLRPSLPTYAQPGVASYIPALSIIDVMMHNSKDATRQMLKGASIVPATQVAR